MKKKYLLTLLPLVSIANAEIFNSPSDKNSHELGQITVTADNNKINNNGSVKLDKYEITDIPQGNGNLDVLVKNNSAVQLNNNSNSSDLAGEIAPSNLSFHGEHFYNNQFSLDGISNTSNLNPAHNGSDTILHKYDIDYHTPNKLPEGHAQSFWISNNMLDSIEIHDSNISARHGRFTGGVVDAHLLKPKLDEFHGKVSYRYSNDHLTHYYIDNIYEAEFKKGESAETQPSFQKHQFHIDVNAPLSENTALLIAYDREESFIPLYHNSLQKQTKQNRRAETFYLNILHELNNKNQINASILYSPHSATYFPLNVKDGKFKNIGGGWRGDINWKNTNKIGQLTSTVSYRETEETTDYDEKDLYRYYSGTPSIDWISDPMVNEATKGGMGKTKLFTKSLVIKQEMDFNPITTGKIEHAFNAGWHYEYATSGIKRNHEAFIYATDLTDSKDCFDCIPGEQYFSWKSHNYRVDANVGNSNAALWIEDNITYKNIELNLGLRVDYNQFLHNANIAPRFNLNYDFDNGIELFGGLNRYYGAEILDYKLRSSYKAQDNYTRYDGNEPWEHSITLDFEGFGSKKIKTPYSDEVSLGIQKSNDVLTWKGSWIRRFSRDQFMTKFYSDEQGRYIRELTNKGRGKHDTFSLSIGSGEPLSIAGASVSWKLGADYQKHGNNQHETYEQIEWEQDNVKKIMVDGKLYNPEDMPAIGDFSRPWGAFLNTNVMVPNWNLQWSQNIRYQKGRAFYDRNNIRCRASDAMCQGYVGNLAKFDGIRFNDSIIADWRFAWKPLPKEKNLTINFDILNVFNHKTVGKKINTPEWEEKKRNVSYQAGRQYWLGLEYKW